MNGILKLIPAAFILTLGFLPSAAAVKSQAPSETAAAIKPVDTGEEAGEIGGPASLRESEKMIHQTRNTAAALKEQAAVRDIPKILPLPTTIWDGEHDPKALSRPTPVAVIPAAPQKIAVPAASAPAAADADLPAEDLVDSFKTEEEDWPLEDYEEPAPVRNR